MSIGDILDQAQEFLHDDGDIWTREELLGWANDGYRQLLAQSHAVVRPFQIDLPGRTTWAASQEWEDRHGQGTFRLFTYHIRSASINATFQWEAQALEGITPEDSTDCVTHLWEMVHADSIDMHSRLVLSKQHERPLKVYHDDKRLIAASNRELDTLATEWWTQTGDPIFWFPTNGGRDGSYEIYELQSAYSQGYDLRDSELGMPRLLSGDRTWGFSGDDVRWSYAYSGYADYGMHSGLGYRFTIKSAADTINAVWDWETDEIDNGTSTDTEESDPVGTQPWELVVDSSLDEDQFRLAMGLVRGVSSDDRQYLAAPYANAEYSTLGAARDWKTSEDAITIWEIIVSATELTEGDGLSLIPSRFGKYIKFYVLSRAFSRKGRGFRADMASHFTALFQVGVARLSKIGNLGFIDRNFAREAVVVSSGYRPPMVQLPPEFERI